MNYLYTYITRYLYKTMYFLGDLKDFEGQFSLYMIFYLCAIFGM